MKIPPSWVVAGALIITIVAAAGESLREDLKRPMVKTVVITNSTNLDQEKKISAAMWEVAKVFGRDDGCKDADQILGRIVAEAALKNDIAPRDVAATISVESNCNIYATSVRGAIGLMQVMPSVWKSVYDFQNKVNLLNQKDAVETGTEILAGYEKKYGRVSGILHYQGMGTGCPTCDGAYTSKILRLADGK